MSTYAFVCQACDHPASIHGLVEGGDLRDGPYRCSTCGCEISQDAPMTPMNETTFRSHMARLLRAEADR